MTMWRLRRSSLDARTWIAEADGNLLAEAGPLRLVEQWVREQIIAERGGNWLDVRFVERGDPEMRVTEIYG